MSIERLKELLSYDPATGIFRWKCSRGRAIAGQKAGTQTDKGYIAIHVDGRHYYAQRLAWAFVTGRWPDPEADHRNGIRHDNRFENLREVTRSQNAANLPPRDSSTSGVKGVMWDKAARLWRAHITVNRKKITIGRFANFDDACRAREAAAEKYWGEFARSEGSARNGGMPRVKAIDAYGISIELGGESE